SHPFRRYQLRALEAFERSRATGETQIHLVSPPGSGKTVLGLEGARRLGRRTLVVCPNTAIQGQWVRQWQDFQPATVAAATVMGPDVGLVVLTYQAIANLDDDASVQEHAQNLWEVSREATVDSYGAAPDDELRAYRAQARRQVAASGDHARLLELLRPDAHRLLETMRTSGPWTIVMDECHHLLSTWGYVMRAFARELGPETVIVAL